MRNNYRFWGRNKPQRSAPMGLADVVSAEEGVATLRIYDPIDSWGGEWGVSAKEFAQAMNTLPDDTTSIRLHLNSPGGEVYEGIAILNTLRNHPARVTAIIDGLAASAASFIAAGADEVIMGRNSQLMIHDAWGLAIGNAEDMRDMSERLDKISNNIASVYAVKAGGNVEEWRAAMLAETWYDADEAVEAGLADSVQEAVPEAEQDARNRFDLSVFQHAPTEPSETPSKASETPPEPEPTSLSEYQKRRHDMNRRKYA